MKITLSRVYEKVLETKRDQKRLKEQALKELHHERLEELYRGKALSEKLIGIIKIISA